MNREVSALNLRIKRRFRIGLFAAQAALLTPTNAQDVISHRPGLLTYTVGVVELLGARPGQDQPGRLVHVEEDQALVTETGRAEILLGPDRFLRLGDATHIELVSAEASDVELRLRAGSVIVDLPRALHSDRITLWCDDARVRIVQRGLYRLDRPPGQRATLKVFRGKAIVAAHYDTSVRTPPPRTHVRDDETDIAPLHADGPRDCPAPRFPAASVTVKARQSIDLPLAKHREEPQASLQSPPKDPPTEHPCPTNRADRAPGSIVVTEFDRSQQDAFEEWSHKRAAGLLQATRRAERAQTQPITDLRAVPGVVIGGGPATSTTSGTTTSPPAQTGGQQGKTK